MQETRPEPKPTPMDLAPLFYTIAGGCVAGGLFALYYYDSVLAVRGVGVIGVGIVAAIFALCAEVTRARHS